MIIVNQNIKTKDKDGNTVFVPPGQYAKLPKELKESKNFLYFVEAGIIEGYTLTKDDKEKFAKLPKLSSVSEKRKAKVLKPDGDLPKKVAKKDVESTKPADGKNKI